LDNRQINREINSLPYNNFLNKLNNYDTTIKEMAKNTLKKEDLLYEMDS